MNQQPWQFVVIDDARVLAEIPGFMPNAAMAARAPLAILVCGDLGLEKSAGYWVVDCAAAVQNMLLAAHALGLGAVWCGVYPRQPRMDGLKRLLGLPENVIAHSLVVLGDAGEQVPPQDRFRPERVRKNHW
jgi:nitroreductase